MGASEGNEDMAELYKQYEVKGSLINIFYNTQNNSEDIPKRFFENDSGNLELDHKKEGKIKGLLSKMNLRHRGGIKIRNKWYSIERFKQVINIFPEINQDNKVAYMEVIE
ncbi:MAG: hypothetical protein KKF48_01910 [Nanoarchaeota archaeon]|nr:hypothetical protein [Nanoarchaeota archaeon]MBU1027775.1 hypothetical protein [Nanoarchaeota archaeon]